MWQRIVTAQDIALTFAAFYSDIMVHFVFQAEDGIRDSET